MQPDFERVHVLAERMMIAMEGENKADVAMAAAMVSASAVHQSYDDPAARRKAFKTIVAIVEDLGVSAEKLWVYPPQQ